MNLFRRCALTLSVVLASTATSAESGDVALTRIAVGEIGGLIVVPVQVGDRVGRWLLDTGSSRNLVSAAFVQHHGLKPGRALAAETALGPLSGNEVVLPGLRIGALDRPGQTALVLDLGSLAGPAAEDLDGVLGLPSLAGLEVTLDLRAWVLRLRPGEGAACPPGTVPMPLGRDRQLPVVEVSINAGPAESYVIDTGNPASLVRITAAAPTSAPGLLLPGGARLALAARATIGPQTHLNVPVLQLAAPALRRALAPAVSGLLGTALLDGTVWQLDMARQRGCVEPDQVTTPGGFGLTTAWRDGALHVAAVLANGPAQVAGLREGEVIKRWAGLVPDASVHRLWVQVQAQAELELVMNDGNRTVVLRRAYFLPLLPP